MAEQARTVNVGEKDGWLMTVFKPPISANKLFEATTSAFSMREIVRDRDNERKIWGIMYEIGDRSDFQQRVVKMKDEIETNTSYVVEGEVVRLGSTATKAAAQMA